MVRLIGFPTRKTNSSQASSSHGPAQRQMTSLRDRDEYRVGLGESGISLHWGGVARGVGKGQSTRDGMRDVKSGYQSASRVVAVHPAIAIFGEKAVSCQKQGDATRIFRYVGWVGFEINEATGRVGSAITARCCRRD